MKRSPLPPRAKPMRRTAIAPASKAKPLGLLALSTMTRKEWRDHLDDLFRAVVMIPHGAARMPTNDAGTRFGWYGVCLHCPATTWLYVSHIEPKGEYASQRWESDNAFPFCYPCHMHWWHKNPRAALEFRERKLGKQASDRLALRARIGGRSWPDYQITHLRLVQQLRAIAPHGVPGLLID